METIRIATESPKTEQWKLLTQFSYPTNIRRYMSKHGLPTVGDETLEYIAGCIRQGEAYFVAGENSPLDIRPLLLYYGSVNLLAGASAMIMGMQPNIKGHGMRLQVGKTQPFVVGQIEILPTKAKDGALQQFANVFSKGCVLINGSSWTVEEVLGSVPDLKREYEECYPTAIPYTVPIEIVKRRRGSLERIIRSDLVRYKDPENAISKIEGFNDSYLPAEYLTGYIVLHRKIGSEEIGTYSIFGQKYLQIGHDKNGRLITPDQVIILFMGLFALSYLSRYSPEVWNPFVKSDETGEKLVIERFLDISSRFLPNLILNAIYGARLQLAYESRGVLDLTGSLSSRDLEYMLEDMKQRRQEGD